LATGTYNTCADRRVGIYVASFDLVKRAEVARASARLTLYDSGLSAALDQYTHLPVVLAQDSHVLAGVAGQNLQTLYIRLRSFAASAGVDAIYLMDVDGLTIAASNFDETPTFLGNSYAFRPYFQTAMGGNSGQFFAIGVTTLKPGYFLSRPVRNSRGDIRGVIAVKVDLSPLAQTWARTGENVFVSNPDGVVVLASDTAWRYQTLSPLSGLDRADIERGQQFANEPLMALDWSSNGTSARLNDVAFIHLRQNVGPLRWRVHYLSPKAALHKNAALATFVFLAVLAVAIGVWLQLRARRVRNALQASQEDRRKLGRINQALAKEIEDRRVAEARLEKAQIDLQRSSKLAALSQLSASVTHELGQPLSAMKTYLTAAEIQGTSTPKVLGKLGGLVSRMEQITTQLRFFAKPSDAPFKRIDLRNVWDNAFDLVRHDITAARIKVQYTPPADPIWIEGNSFRLEQVVINILKNAVLAIAEAPSTTAVIHVLLEADGRLTIIDTGLGLQGKSLQTLQEPFVTTRSSGTGMGLGLAISAGIVAEHLGTLCANDTATGAKFILTLPLAQRRTS
jgi:two-component system C4-dicarboxylate transport sensor histidine kinase DctB